MKPQIVNIINFIRGVEPRVPELDLLEPVEKQIKLLKEYRLPGTFLIQYDAMLQEKFSRLLISELDDNFEIGGWLEIVQPLVEKAGLEWRGRPGFPWDWHANTGFSIGYTPEEREKLADVFMEDFKSIFGYYPASVGSWLTDAHTLAYLERKYGIKASCNCRDQWGTDGYTMWGGYYGQAYYPSIKNVFSPAQTIENQINVPVFRMLGSDPIYQYDAGLEQKNGEEMKPSSFQPVVTLEPSYTEEGGGGSPEWVKWFFRENFNGLCLSFGYAQAGQENSFGWEAMSKGLEFQFKYIAQLAAEGKITAQTLKATGEWYKSSFILTPAASIAALADWQDNDCKSVWFNSSCYRVNFFWKGNKFLIRDIHYFNEAYEERYLNSVCSDEVFVYDNLPVIDGNRWSGGRTRAGISLVEIMPDGTFAELTGGEPVVRENGQQLQIEWPLNNGGVLNIECSWQSLRIACRFAEKQLDWGLKMVWSSEAATAITRVGNKAVSYMHNGFVYTLNLDEGYAKRIGENNILIKPSEKTDGGSVSLSF